MPFLKKAFKFAGYFMVGLILLMAVAFAAVYLKYRPERLKELIAGELSQTLNSRVTISKLGYNWDSSIRLKGVRVFDADPGSKPLKKKTAITPMVAVADLRLFLNPASVFKKSLEIVWAGAYGAQIHVIKVGSGLNIERIRRGVAKKPAKSTLRFRAISVAGVLNWGEPRQQFRFETSIRPLARSAKVKVTTQQHGEVSVDIDWPASLNLLEPAPIEKRLENLGLDFTFRKLSRRYLKQWATQVGLPAALDGRVAMHFRKDAISLGLTNFALVVGGKKVRATGEVLKKGKALSSRRLSLAFKGAGKIFIRRLQLKGGLQSLSASGKVPMSLFGIKARGTVSGAITYDRARLFSNSQVKVNNLQLGAIEAKAIDLSLVGDQVRVIRAPIRLAGQAATITGSYSILKKKTSITLLADVLDATGLMKMQSARKMPPLTMKVSVKKLKLKSAQLDNLVADLVIRAQGISIQRAKFNFHKAAFSYRGSGPSFALQFDGLKSQRLGGTFTIFKRVFAVFAGKINGRFLSSRLPKSFEQIEFTARVTTGPGKLMGTNLQSYLSGALSPLADKLNALQFGSLSLNLRKRGRLYYLQGARFSGSNLKLLLVGRFNREYRGDLTVKLQVHRRFLEDVANPLIASLREQRLGDWYMLPLQCSGAILEKTCWQKSW